MKLKNEAARARAYWEGLDAAGRWELGDQMVLGDLDYLYWFGKKESRSFLDALDHERLLWEQSGAR